MSRSSNAAKRRYYREHKEAVSAYLRRTREHREILRKARVLHMLQVIRAAWRPVRG